MRLIDADKLKKDMLIQNILGEPIQKMGLLAMMKILLGMILLGTNLVKIQ